MSSTDDPKTSTIPGTEGADAYVEELKRVIGRECGDCSLCCYVLDIDALNKPANTWCEHCRPGRGGCSIYADRPPVCRGFACLWLTNRNFEPHWFPKRAKIVAHFKPDGSKLLLALNVDRRFPHRWREEPYHSEIQQLALKGLTDGFLGTHYSTRVYVGERGFLILPPDREIEITDDTDWVIVPTGPGQWDRIRVKSKTEGEELIRKMQALKEEVQRNPALRAEMLQYLKRHAATTVE